MRSITLLTLGVLVGVVALGGTIRALCAPLPLGTSLWMDAEKVSDGYLLIAPYYSDLRFDESGEVFLMDNKGRIAHTWKTKYPTLISYLQPNGHLLAAMTPPIDIKDYPSGGSSGLIQELDWDGNVLWEYADSQMTHDFEILPDGRIAYVRWHEASPSFAAKVQGGMRVASTSVWTNELVIINKNKEIEWTWRPDDYMDPRNYTLSPMVPRTDWAHINSVRYLERNPLTGTPAFLMSARHLSKVFMVDSETGNVLWESPEGLFTLQHDATLTQDGTILAFDNGLFRNIPIPVLMSGVGEVDPKTNKVVWSWNGGKSPIEKMQFTSHFMSGTERLPNGNTLVVASAVNTMLEVTKEGETVWKYTSDWRDEKGRMRIIFKANKYTGEGTEWVTKIPADTSLSCPL